MISDDSIIQKFQEWLRDNTQFLTGDSIINDSNGKLVNTENLFEDDSLKINSPSGLQRDIVQFFQYSGLSEEDKKSYMTTEPTAFLLKGNGLKNEQPFIQTIGKLGLKLSDNSKSKGFKNYNNEQFKLNKLYSTDSGVLKSGKGHDIPLREIANSQDAITFTSSQQDDELRNRNKRLFIAGGPSFDEFMPIILRKYINEIINYNSTNVNFIYHGECKFFSEYPIFSDGMTVKDFCNGNFSASGNLLSASNPNYNRHLVFYRDTLGWRLDVRENAVLVKVVRFDSITRKFKDYPTGSYPLPVKSDLVPDDIVKWEVSYKLNFAESQINTLSLGLESSTEGYTAIFVNNWNTTSSNDDTLIHLTFSSDLVDLHGNKIDVNKHYTLIEIGLGHSYDSSFQGTSFKLTHPMEIDKDPFKATITIRNPLSYRKMR